MDMLFSMPFIWNPFPRIGYMTEGEGSLARPQVKKGIKEGFISPPELFKKSISKSQLKLALSCIFKGIEVYL